MNIRRGVLAGVMVTVMVAAGATANAAPADRWSTALVMLAAGGVATAAVVAGLIALTRGRSSSRES